MSFTYSPSSINPANLLKIGPVDVDLLLLLLLLLLHPFNGLFSRTTWVIAKFHYTGPTGPDRTRANPHGPARTRTDRHGLCRRPARTNGVSRRSGSGRARVVEFS